MEEIITLAHGGGGKFTGELIEKIFLPYFDNPALRSLDDGALLEDTLIFTCDSYTVKPIFFPGGDIGRLAIYGTVNDLAVSGAKPLYISLSFIIEEGFKLSELKKIARSIGEAAAECGITIAAGDTKVVRSGEADGIFIISSGIGKLMKGASLGFDKVNAGDSIILNGPVGDHGAAILASREGFLDTFPVKSDCAPLAGLIEELIEKFGASIHWMRDLTRGGLAQALCDLAKRAGFGIIIDEERVPVREPVASFCEILGLDIYEVACEGRFIAVVEGNRADDILKFMRSHPLGEGSSLIGKVRSENVGTVIVNTKIGGRRVLDEPLGEQLPRIC